MQYAESYINSLTFIQGAVPNRDKLRGSSILITGGGGLICSAIADFLLNLNDTEHYNIHVYVTDRSMEHTMKRYGDWVARQDLTILEQDIINPLPGELQFDFIIHGASNASPAAFASEPVEVMLANFVGMKNVLEYAKGHCVKSVLYISSSEVYGEKQNADPYDESTYYMVDILNPRACYPSSKRAAETLCAAYAKEYDVHTVIVRPGHIYGPAPNPKDNRAASQFARDAVAGRDIVMKSTGQQLRSYTYVLDCVTAIVTVLLNGNSGEAYNISNPDSVVTIRQLAECMAEVGGVKVVFDCPNEIERTSYNLMSNSALTSDKIVSLGWKGYFSLKDGVKATLESMLSME